MKKFTNKQFFLYQHLPNYISALITCSLRPELWQNQDQGKAVSTITNIYVAIFDLAYNLKNENMQEFIVNIMNQIDNLGGLSGEHRNCVKEGIFLVLNVRNLQFFALFNLFLSFLNFFDDFLGLFVEDPEVRERCRTQLPQR